MDKLIKEALLKEEKRQNELQKQAELQKAKQSEELQKAQAEDGLLDQFAELPTEVKSEIVNSMLEKNKAVRKIYDSLNNVYLEYGFQAYKQSQMFKGILIAEMKAYKKEAKAIAYKEEKEQLISNFESLTPSERVEEIKTMLKLKKNNKAVYEALHDDFLNFGVNAHKQSQVFYSYLVEHLVMSKIVQE